MVHDGEDGQGKGMIEGIARALGRKPVPTSPFPTEKALVEGLETLYRHISKRVYWDIPQEQHPYYKLDSWCSSAASAWQDHVNQISHLQSTLNATSDDLRHERSTNKIFTQHENLRETKANQAIEDAKRNAERAQKLQERLDRAAAEWTKQEQRLKSSHENAMNLRLGIEESEKAKLRGETARVRGLLEEAIAANSTLLDENNKLKANLLGESKKLRAEAAEALREKDVEIDRLKRVVGSVKDTWQPAAAASLLRIFSELKQRIKALPYSSPLLPNQHSQDAMAPFRAVDSIGFLTGARQGKSQDFVTAMTWHIIHRGFFTREGFGIFGPDSSLARMHASFPDAFGYGLSGESGGRPLPLTDLEVSKWRFATLDMVRKRLDRSMSGHNALSATFEEHVRAVASEVKSLLARIIYGSESSSGGLPPSTPGYLSSGGGGGGGVWGAQALHRLSISSSSTTTALSGPGGSGSSSSGIPPPLPEGLDGKVDSIARLAADFALTLATQRARVFVHLPGRGAPVQPRDEFKLNYDTTGGGGGGGGNSLPGQGIVVRTGSGLSSGSQDDGGGGGGGAQTGLRIEQVVCPSLRKIGDGQDDLVTMQILAQGEVYVSSS